MLLPLGVVLLVCLLSRHAWAVPGVLVVMRATDTVDVSPYELRLRSELQTEGIDAVVINGNASTSNPKALASRFGANGIIEVTLVNEEATASVWVSDAALALEISRSIKVNLSQRDSVAVFALRCVDLFVGAKLELEQQRRIRSPASSSNEAVNLPDVTAPTNVPAPAKPNAAGKLAESVTGTVKPVTEPPVTDAKKTAKTESQERSSTRGGLSSVQSRSDRFRLGGGVAIMQFTDQLQRRIAPSLSAVLPLSKNWAAGLTLTGPFIATILLSSRADGGAVESNRATIDQEFLWMDGRYRWALSKQFDVEPNLGLGVARYGVSGESGGTTYVGRNAAVASLLTSLGGSLVWRVAPQVRLMAEVTCLVRWQTPMVEVDDRDETGTSPFNFWGSFGPAWVF